MTTRLTALVETAFIAVSLQQATHRLPRFEDWVTHLVRRPPPPLLPRDGSIGWIA